MMADIDTSSKVSSSFDGAGRPDAATATVRKRFLHESRNLGVKGAIKMMEARNEVRAQTESRDLANKQVAKAKEVFKATVSWSAVKAAGSRTSTATIDGVRGLLTEYFKDGQVVRTEFKPC